MLTIKTAAKFALVWIVICLLLAVSTSFSSATPLQTPDIGVTGDAFADLVVGVPGEHILQGLSYIEDAGMIHIIYGNLNGLATPGNETYHQNVDFVEDQAEEDDEFGYALASGDFDGDGNSDLAVGIRYEDIYFGGSQVSNAGAVQVFYGSETAGIAVAGDQLWHQGSPNIEGTPETNDRFGHALAVGNFNGDTYDDLAIGVPYEDFEKTTTILNAGAVQVIYGSASGLSATAVVPDQLWYQGVGGAIIDTAEDNDWFGYALAVGNFDGDDYDDLAIGAPGEDSSVKTDMGVVHVLYGSSTGLNDIGDQQWEQYDWGGSAESEDYDYFGKSLVAGSFYNSNIDDLAIGVPDEDIDGIIDAGAVNVLHGSTSGGLDDDGVEFIYQDGGMIEETAESFDQFGYSLAAVAFASTTLGLDSLVVGVPYENIDGVNDAGAVHVLKHYNWGFEGDDANFLHQGRATVPDSLETNASFGFSLEPGDFNGDGKQDLAIGVPYDDCTSSDDGAVVVLYRNSWYTPDIPPAQYWCQGVDLVDSGGIDEHFGLSLAALPSSGPMPHRLFLPLVMSDG